jgi:hypothetical protein
VSRQELFCSVPSFRSVTSTINTTMRTHACNYSGLFCDRIQPMLLTSQPLAQTVPQEHNNSAIAQITLYRANQQLLSNAAKAGKYFTGHYSRCNQQWES